MAIRNIVKYGEDILRMRSREVTEFDNRLCELLDDMAETMFASKGVGLAAVQVGILKRVCIVCVDGKKKYELINPVIVSASDYKVDMEACLSVPQDNARVSRPSHLEVKAFDRNGKLQHYKVKNFTARAFCHEIDHLDGRLFIDIAEWGDND